MSASRLPPEDPGCVEVEALLPLIADDAIGPTDEPAVFAHLARCEPCQRSLARHDLIDLAIAAGRCREDRPAARHWLRLSWPLASGLAASLVAAIAGTLMAPTPGPAPATALKPVREVFRLERPGGPPLYMVRDGDREMVIDPSEQPVPAERGPAGPQQVLYRWY